MKLTHNHALALRLATDHGLPVFPARERPREFIDQKTGETKKLGLKSPYTKNGLKDATTDTQQINAWWSKYPDALVAVICGERSGLLVIDIDTGINKCGEESFAATGLTIPKTVQTKTMSGGRHLFFKYPHGHDIKNSASTHFGPDVDVRGEGGYIIFAGSLLPDGRRYEPISGLSLEEVEVATLPKEYLQKLLASTKSSTRKKGSGTREGARNDTLFRNSVISVHGGLSDEDVLGVAFGLNKTFAPPLDVAEVESAVASAISYRKNSRLPHTDLGNAERFLQAGLGRVRFVSEHRAWVYFDNQRWVFDDAEVARIAHETVRQIARESVNGDPDDLQQTLRWQKTSEANARIKSMLEIASQLKGLSISQQAFDTLPHLVNFTNGTLDLRKGEFREARPGDMITKICGCAWEPTAAAPRFIQFVSEVLGGDEKNIRYLQKFIGYILSGDRQEQLLLILIGDGGDGKSTLIETLKRLMGDYQTTLSATSISAQNTASIPNDIAKLAGRRLATISELPQKLHVNTQLVKAMTGGDTLTARFLHKEYFDFQPTAQMLAATSFYPYADPADKAFFRRLAFMRFPKSFANDNPDKDLKSKLASELSGIAAWAFEGYKAFLREGLEPTPSMLAELGNYSRFADPLTGFFDNCIEVTKKERDFVTTEALLEAAIDYCRSEDCPLPNKADVIRHMDRRGLQRIQRRQCSKRLRGYLGLKLVSYSESEVPF